jgi:hypothetical protein
MNKKKTNKRAKVALALAVIAIFFSKIAILALLIFVVSYYEATLAKKEIAKTGEGGNGIATITEYLSGIFVAIGLFLFLSSFLVGMSSK